MRTQDWKAGNAPAGPRLTVRCACGAALTTLPAGRAVARARGDSTDSTVTCTSCERTVRIGVPDGG